MKHYNIDRRAVLRRVGGAIAGLSVGASDALPDESGVVQADDGSDSMVPGKQYKMREAGSFECGLDKTHHTDHNWGVTFIGQDGNGNYTFAATSTFHTYRDKHLVSSRGDANCTRDSGGESHPEQIELDVEPDPVQQRVKLDVDLIGCNDEQTNLIEEEKDSGPYDDQPYTTLEGLAGNDWSNWKAQNEGNQPSESTIEAEWESTEYGDRGNIPEWVSHAAFAAGVGASSVSGGSLAVVIKGATTAVSAIDFINWLSDFNDDTGRDYDRGNEYYYSWWDYGGNMALTTQTTRFTVSVGGDERGLPRLVARVYQSFDATSVYDDAHKTPNCGQWWLHIPPYPDSDPSISYRNTQLNADGHSHP